MIYPTNDHNFHLIDYLRLFLKFNFYTDTWMIIKCYVLYLTAK